MSWKNYILTRMVRLLSNKSNAVKNSESPRILIASTTGLGDSLWGTPAIRALKSHFPKSFLGLLTSPIGAALYKNNPYLDEIYTIKKPILLSCGKLLFPLKKKQFEIALIFHFSQRPILPLVSLCSPNQIIGTTQINKGLDKLLTYPLKRKHQHEIKRRLEMVKAIGVPSKGTNMDIFLTKNERETAKNLLNQASFPIGIHPGAKNRFKQWDPIHFINLGRRLQKEYGATAFITGGYEEKALAQKVASHIPGAYSLAGTLSVRETAALIEIFKVFLTNDTGPMHIAYAMKTPTFSPFAPTDSSLCGPCDIIHSALIQKQPTCSPCLSKKCCKPFCLEQISEAESWARITKLIESVL